MEGASQDGAVDETRPRTPVPDAADRPDLDIGVSTEPADVLLSSTKLRVTDRHGRVRKIQDTPRNRRAQEYLAETTVGNYYEDEPELFGDLTEGEEQSTWKSLNNKAAIAMIDQITIGTALMDVRHLNTKYDDATKMTQRPIDRAHIEDLIKSFKLSGIARVAPQARLYVAMGREDVDACVKKTQDLCQGADYESLAATIGDTTLAARYLTEKDVPKLVVPTAQENNGTKVYAVVQAGQHRITALKELAIELDLLQSTRESRYGLVSPEEYVARQVETVYSWTVTLLDKDRLFSPEYTLALTNIRQNKPAVYAPDSDGVAFYNALGFWENLPVDQREKLKKNFREFLGPWMQQRAANHGKILRIFKNAHCRKIARNFVRTMYGRDLFTVRSFLNVVNIHCAPLVETIFSDIEAKVSRIFEVGNLPDFDDQLPNRMVNPVEQVSLAELTSVDMCFSAKGVDSRKLLQLFFPRSDDKRGDFAMPTLTPKLYESQVNIGWNQMNESGKENRGGRMHHRPNFLVKTVGLTTTELDGLYNYLANSEIRKLDRPYPTDKDLDSLFLPTQVWWDRFTGDVAFKLSAVLRLHWFCIAPQDWPLIHGIVKGGGAARKLGDNFDIGIKFQQYYEDFLARAFDDLYAAKAAADEVVDVDLLNAEEKVRYNQSKLMAKKRAPLVLKKYLLELYKVVNRMERSVTEVRDGCQILKEWALYPDSPQHRQSFWNHLLVNKFIGETLDVLTRHFGSGMLTGIAAPLAAKEIIDDNGHSSAGFWQIPTHASFDLRDGVRALLKHNQHVDVLNTTAKDNIGAEMGGIVDLFNTSITLEKYTLILADHLARNQATTDQEVGTTEHIVYGKDSGQIKNAKMLDQVKNVIESALHRLSYDWAVVGMPTEVDDWMDLGRRSRQLLPHRVPELLASTAFVISPSGLSSELRMAPPTSTTTNYNSALESLFTGVNYDTEELIRKDQDDEKERARKVKPKDKTPKGKAAAAQSAPATASSTDTTPKPVRGSKRNKAAAPPLHAPQASKRQKTQHSTVLSQPTVVESDEDVEETVEDKPLAFWRSHGKNVADEHILEMARLLDIEHQNSLWRTESITITTPQARRNHTTGNQKARLEAVVNAFLQKGLRPDWTSHRDLPPTLQYVSSNKNKKVTDSVARASTGGAKNGKKGAVLKPKQLKAAEAPGRTATQSESEVSDHNDDEPDES